MGLSLEGLYNPSKNAASPSGWLYNQSQSDSHDNYADRTSAATEMSFYEDYMARFQPIEDLVMASLDPSYYQQQARESQAAAGGQFDRSIESTDRNIASLGLQLTPKQQEGMDRRNALAKAKAQGGAYNNSYDNAANMTGMVFGMGSGR